MRMTNYTRKNQTGVSLIEVLIALLITAVGVLGLAKMQALTVSNSQVSGLRGLIALQASSLASIMHSGKVYWQVPSTATPNCAGASACVMSGTTIAGTFGTAPSSCLNTNVCNPTQLVAWDMTQWIAQTYNIAPSHTTTINCSATALLPVVCEIEITWLEKQSGGGTATASIAAATPAVAQAYYLYVQP